jgi:hypothetical protein
MKVALFIALLFAADKQGPAGLPLSSSWKVTQARDGSLVVPHSYAAVRRYYDEALAGRPGLTVRERRTPSGREATISWLSSTEARTTAVLRERPVSTEIRVSVAASAVKVSGSKQQPGASYVLEPNVGAVRDAANGITDDHVQQQARSAGKR